MHSYEFDCAAQCNGVASETALSLRFANALLSNYINLTVFFNLLVLVPINLISLPLKPNEQYHISSIASSLGLDRETTMCTLPIRNKAQLHEQACSCPYSQCRPQHHDVVTSLSHRISPSLLLDEVQCYRNHSTHSH